jgi:hypothetical protein
MRYCEARQRITAKVGRHIQRVIAVWCHCEEGSDEAISRLGTLPVTQGIAASMRFSQ